jgi:HAD superfamily hydrolase (TIGR01490 family)
MRPGVALFDLDRTLLDCNSGRLWVAAEWREGRISTRDLAWAGYWLARYSLGLDDGLEQVFDTAVASLQGISEDELDSRVRLWFEREVRHRLRPGGLRALEHHRERGDRLVLATSGTLYAARAAQEAYQLDDIVCTRFEVRDGVFTGRVSDLAVGAAKADRVREWATEEGVELSSCSFYTDSATDLALLEEVGQPRVVHPDRTLARTARQRGWPILDWGTT